MHNCLETRFGRYELVRELGRGLKSIVYLAHDPEIQRPVALKVFSATVVPPEVLFRRVKEISNLSHLGIGKVFDVRTTEPDGVPYLVLEYVEGDSLESVLESKGKLAQDASIALSLELLDALSYAHSHHVNHHNLKPSNLIITPDRHLKIADFLGIRSSTTAFVAPEQLSGAGDTRSDLFSVGVILYLMLSGHRPFQGNTDATIGFKLVHQHPVPVAAMDMELSPELDFIIARLLAKNPDERYQSAAEAKRALESISVAAVPKPSASPSAAGLSILIGQIGFSGNPERMPPPVRRAPSAKPAASPASWLLIGSVLIVLLFLTSIIAMRPMLQPLPSAPVAVSSHLVVPAFATEKRTALPRSRKVRPVPVVLKPPHPVATPAGKPASQLVSVPVEVHQPFNKYVMTIWVDDRLNFSHEIQPEKKKRFLHTETADYMTLIQLPAGEHALRVQITAVGETFEGDGTLSTSISEISGQKLLIRCDKSHKQVQVALN
jgi:serine/threonine-protein kinase